MQKEQLKDWLIKNRAVLSVKAIETAIGCPDTTLQKVLQGRELPKKWVIPLGEFIQANLNI